MFIKLVPVILALRKDRILWIAQEGKGIDEKRFRRNAQRILNTCISLGPVFIKFGQWLSSRADILPQPYLEELSKLQDSVPAAPFDKVRPIIEKDIGKIEEKFDDLDQNSLSGASLGQVHRATKNGQQVIVKIKRPGIEKQVEKDLKVLMKIIPFAMKFVDPNLRFSIIPIMKQFADSIHEEMDYTKELDNLKKIKKNMKPYNNASFRILSTSCLYPFVKNFNDLEARSGVLRRPSLSGSSPMRTSNSLIKSSMFYLSFDNKLKKASKSFPQQ